MKIYLVGGAVRDKLLGLEPKDRDWVIIGATEEDIQGLLDQGFTQVGKDFPVFLHPETNEEYALARTERKTGPGHQGFECYAGSDVTLADDLGRRDLTINAMAMDVGTGEIFDPYGGQEDLRNKVLRHTTDAFAEDPLRVMRVARFHARYRFDVHPSTVELCKQLVINGALNELSADRLWGEYEKLLSTKHPLLGTTFLIDIGINPTPEQINVPGLAFMTGKLNTFYAPQAIALSRKVTQLMAIHDLSQFSKKQLQRMRVPTNLIKNFQFFREVYTVFMSISTLVENVVCNYSDNSASNDEALMETATVIVNSYRKIRSLGLYQTGIVNWALTTTIIMHHQDFGGSQKYPLTRHDMTIISDAFAALRDTSMEDLANHPNVKALVFQRQLNVVHDCLTSCFIRT